MRKKKSEPTLVEQRLQSLINEIYNAISGIREDVISLEATKSAIAILPDGADKKALQVGYAIDQDTLLAHMGHYDGLVRDYKEYIKNHQSELSVVPIHWPISHKIVVQQIQGMLFN